VNHDEQLEAWIARQGRGPVPPDFGERVMAAVRRRADRGGARDWWSRPGLRAAAWAAAALVLAARAVATVLVFWARS
jgi:hypothetical protein